MIESSSSIFFFTMILWALNYLESGASRLDYEYCKVSKCRHHHGPAIRYPFRLQHLQPEHCSYPQRGFTLSCTDQDDTALDLALPQHEHVRLLVKGIDYKSQIIRVSDPDDCLPRLLPTLLPYLNSSASTFQTLKKFLRYNYSLFNCTQPSPDRDLVDNMIIPCLSTSSSKVHAIFSDDYMESGQPIAFCNKIGSISLPQFIPNINFKKLDLQLSWNKPDCRNCEAKGEGCRLNNIKEPRVECYEVPESPRKLKGAFAKLVVTGVSLVLFLLVLISIGLYRFCSTNKAEREHQAKIEKFLEDYRTLKPTRYSYADIKRITNQFKDKLGQGGYGTVFKGKLSSEIFVAVKILNITKGNGEEFLNEVGTMGRIHHVNVVRLVGFCADGFRRALVYEFLPHESLEKFIFSGNLKNSLGWNKFKDIALGISKGIEYLHEGCDQRILHFDIKPQNVLLDQNFNPKISDFGLAKLCSKEQSVISMTTNSPRGTMGYIAPEVFSRNFGSISHKSDVYSFGMLLLDMVDGRRTISVSGESSSQCYFPDWIYNRLERQEAIGSGIDNDWDANIVKQLTIVGLWCIQWYPRNRPSMKEVVQMLEGEGESLTMPPNAFASTNTMTWN